MVTSLLLALAGLAAQEASAAPTTGPCADLMPHAPLAVPAKRAAEAADLIRLRDFGLLDQRLVGEQGFTVSPDRKRVAVQLRRATPDLKGYCVGTFILDAKPGARPRLVDWGTEVILWKLDIAGLEELHYGSPDLVTPRWSPDGRWLAYRKSENGRVQVWRVAADGGEASPVTEAASDVVDFEWLASSDGVVFKTRPGVAAQEAAIEAEGAPGWRYDRRFYPQGGFRPRVTSPVATAYLVKPVDGPVRPATAEESAIVDAHRTGIDSNPVLSIDDPRHGGRARLEPVDPGGYFSAVRLKVRFGGVERSCATCGKVQDLWWTPKGDLLFVRLEGVNWGTLGFYRWRANDKAPRLLFRTIDRLIGCQTIDEQKMLCAHEASTTPRRLVLLDVASGRMQPVLNANPELDAVALAPARRLNWKDRFGNETYGDLVLPLNHKPGERHPLVVVQYTSQGFLRGGTGDEVPIQLLAQRGYAVLSFQRPFGKMAQIKASTMAEFYAKYNKDWAGRRGIVDLLEAGVSKVISLGVADPRRVAITGLSDGAVTAEFALVNTRLFSAAMISTCCYASHFGEWLGGLGFSELTREMGEAGRNEPGHDAYWKSVLLGMNAPSLDVPILINAGEYELLGAIPEYAALKEAGKPVEMYVYPGEGHIKFVPLHRLAVYERTMDWFDYWLSGKRDSAPAKQEQYKAWDALPRPEATAGTALRK
ncbi:MAG: Atxe2 family lasso peptide isopeptidase [Alphaproteobacteria bacterium]|nr:MAG: Atxe2 family lasso peptide isopeptidase [Alphaproteobacteria bacterium]